jgi:Mg2+ and Co2+ transporter CorA
MMESVVVGNYVLLNDQIDAFLEMLYTSNEHLRNFSDSCEKMRFSATSLSIYSTAAVHTGMMIVDTIVFQSDMLKEQWLHRLFGWNGKQLISLHRAQTDIFSGEVIAKDVTTVANRVRDATLQLTDVISMMESAKRDIATHLGKVSYRTVVFSTTKTSEVRKVITDLMVDTTRDMQEYREHVASLHGPLWDPIIVSADDDIHK